MTQPLLQVDALRTHIFTRAGVIKAVDDASFVVDHGEVLGLVGESGSGKSMLGYSIIGLVDSPGRIVGGRLAFAGRDLALLSAEEMQRLRGDRVSMILQDPIATLNPALRIDTQMVETILAHQPVSRSAARARARAALVTVGVPSPDERLRAYPHQCSRSMRQRVAIAIALLNRPDLIIADEATAELDVTVRGQVLHEMQRLTREAGVALIWITQDLPLIAGLADRVCVMYAGRIVEQGATADVLCAPRHPYTRALLDSVPGTAPPREKLRQIPGVAPSLIELPPGCAFRPRCPYAGTECTQEPEVRSYGGIGQTVRCFHPLPRPG
jgi:peptide/nickel transport system ATP-binding protein